MRKHGWVRRVAIWVVSAFVATTLLLVAPVTRASAAPSCVAKSLGTTFAPPGDGVSTDGLGPAPAYYEIGEPAGAFRGKPVKAIMLIIHGGGWRTVGKEAVADARGFANHWRAQGWQTINLDFRACEQSLPDVIWFMQRLRQLAPSATVCAEGISSGGHLALMLASARPDLACVISLGGPTDATSLLEQTSYNPKTHMYDDKGPRELYYSLTTAFGGQTQSISPAYYRARIKARVFVASAVRDVIVPREQNEDYVNVLRAAQPKLYVDRLLLQPGREPFPHTKGVSKASLKKYYEREAALVAPLVRG